MYHLQPIMPPSETQGLFIQYEYTHNTSPKVDTMSGSWLDGIIRDFKHTGMIM